MLNCRLEISGSILVIRTSLGIAFIVVKMDNLGNKYILEDDVCKIESRACIKYSMSLYGLESSCV